MRYKNGRDVLPPELLIELQKYIDGELIYIPKKEDSRASWGALTGTRELVYRRNSNIMQKYETGASVCELQEEYCLSEASIRKIIYNGIKERQIYCEQL